MTKKFDLDFLAQLVRCRPVSTDLSAVNKVVGKMRARLEECGLYCLTEDFSGRQALYASTSPGKTCEILLNSHLDVVPANTEEQYQTYIEGEYIYGRGVADCLGNSICVARFLAENRAQPGLAAIFSSDEEAGGQTTAGMIERGYGARRMVLILDGGYGQLISAQKGVLVLSLTATGRGGHSALVWKLDNPIDRLVRGYLNLREAWNNPDSLEDWRNSMMPCIISGGTYPNQVPDTAEITLNIRYIKPTDYEQILAFVEEKTGFKPAVINNAYPAASDENNREMSLLLQKFQKHFPGRQDGYLKMCGATDARHLQALGIPMAIMGLEGGGAHAAQEYLKIAAIEKFTLSLKEFYQKLLATNN